MPDSLYELCVWRVSDRSDRAFTVPTTDPMLLLQVKISVRVREMYGVL